MSILSTLRLSLWGTTIFFTLIVLALSAHLLSLEVSYANEVNNYYGDYGYGNYGIAIPTYDTWTAMAIATAGLTLLTLPVFIGIDMGRTGAFTSMIVVEMVTLTLLWVLWLTTASLIAQASGIIGASAVNCGSNGPCNEFKAVEALSFLIFFTLLAYAFVLLVFTLIAHNRGHGSVWLQSVKQTNFFAPPVNPPEGGEKAMPAMAAPQPQYQYPPNFGTPPPQGMPFVAPGQPMQMQQQPMYPQYTGSPVPQQNPGLPGGQPVYGQA